MVSRRVVLQFEELNPAAETGGGSIAAYQLRIRASPARNRIGA
jgi:hypothetical protein